MGSWARSCRLFGVSGGMFKAECLNSRGRWIASSLRDGSCRTGYGVATDGRLACERKRFVPRGSVGCHLRQLRRRRRPARRALHGLGRRVPRSLVNWRKCGTTITNIGGTLVCDKDIERTRIDLSRCR